MSSTTTKTGPVTTRSVTTLQLEPRAERRHVGRPLRVLTHVVLVVACLMWIVPIVSTVVTSFLPSTYSISHGWWDVFVQPTFTTANYKSLAAAVNIPARIWASIVVAVPITVIGVAIAAIAAYALAWLDVPGRRVALGLVVGLQVVPPQIALAPVLELMNHLGVGSTVVSVWLLQVGLSVPFGILVLYSAFSAVPKELIEAAVMDGASNLRAFTRVLVPVSGGSIAGVAVIFFLWGWNELLGPLVFLGASSPDATMTLAIANLAQGETVNRPLLLAAAVVAIILPLAVFFALQRYFVRGVLGGAVKG